MLSKCQEKLNQISYLFNERKIVYNFWINFEFPGKLEKSEKYLDVVEYSVLDTVETENMWLNVHMHTKYTSKAI